MPVYVGMPPPSIMHLMGGHTLNFSIMQMFE